MALNFNQFDASVRAGFPGGIADYTILPSGTLLYRFSGWDILRADNSVSPWWSETSGLLDTLEGAKKSGKTLWDYVRQQSAVLRGWNSLGYLVMVQLNKPVEGFRGIIAPQNEANPYSDTNNTKYKTKFTKPVLFRGGGGQVFLPNLNKADFDIAIPLGTVYIYDDIDDIIAFLDNYQLL